MMTSKNLHLTFLVVTIFSIFLLVEGVSYGQIENRVDIVSISPFHKTVNQVESALKEAGMMIVAKIDHQNMMKMVGVSMKGSVTLEFGKAAMSKMVFPDVAEAGLEMPGKIYIWERKDGKVIVSYMDPASAWARYNNENLKKVGEMMKNELAKIVEKGTK